MEPLTSGEGAASVSLTYAVVERERRFLVSTVPDGVTRTIDIVDRHVNQTRLRLREMRSDDGGVVRKLSHKVRLGDGPAEVACTNSYLDDREWDVLVALPAAVLEKRRHVVERDSWRIVVDEHADGTLVAEVDDGDEPSDRLPSWLTVLRDVSADERWTGAQLARTSEGAGRG